MQCQIDNTDTFSCRFLSESELIEHQIAEQQQQQLAQQAAGSSTVISAGHLPAGAEVAGSPQRNYYMWKDSMPQPQQQQGTFLPFPSESFIRQHSDNFRITFI